MSVNVKILEFVFKEITLADAERELEQWLDEGYSIVSQSENIESLTYTLVKKDTDINLIVKGDGGAPAHKYQLVNGSVEQVLH